VAENYDSFVFGAFFGLACGALASLFVFNFLNNKNRAERYTQYSLLLNRLNELTGRDWHDESGVLDEEE